MSIIDNDKKNRNEAYIELILNEIDERKAAKQADGYGLGDIVDEFSIKKIPDYSDVTVVNEINNEKATETVPEKEKLISFKEAFDWTESVMVSVLSIVIAMTFFFNMNVVYGISMQPTLYEGDRLIVLPLLGGPKFGDIVIIEAMNLYNNQTGELGEPIVKRVIGVAGDTIFIDAATGGVYRNGELLEEKYIAEKISIENIGNQEYPLTVKENEVFVMGDNRNHSTDSRYAKGYLYYVDCVGLEYVLGKAAFRIWPPESIGGLY